MEIQDLDGADEEAPTELDSTTASSSMEHLLEHVVLAELAQEAWFGRRQLIDILHSAVDAFGHDVVLECGPVLRHVQIQRLADWTPRPAPTRSTPDSRIDHPAVWCGSAGRFGRTENRVDIEYRWFGGLPGEPLPDLGDVVAKHTKANAAGVKLERPDIRRINLGRFERLNGASELLQRLFGAP